MKQRSLRWFRHLQRMENNKEVKMAWVVGTEETCRSGRPRWKKVSGRMQRKNENYKGVA